MSGAIDLETRAGVRGGSESERAVLELDPLEMDDYLDGGRTRILTVADDNLTVGASSERPSHGQTTSITVSWDTPTPPSVDAADLIGFEVAWRTAIQIGFPLAQRRIVGAAVNSVALPALRPSTQYFVKVIAYFRSSRSNELSVTTLGPI